MQIIKAKVLPATNFKPTRIKLTVVRGNPFEGGKDTIIVPFNNDHTWYLQQVEAMGYRRLFADGVNEYCERIEA